MEPEPAKPFPPGTALPEPNPDAPVVSASVSRDAESTGTASSPTVSGSVTKSKPSSSVSESSVEGSSLLNTSLPSSSSNENPYPLSTFSSESEAKESSSESAPSAIWSTGISESSTSSSALNSIPLEGSSSSESKMSSSPSISTSLVSSSAETTCPLEGTDSCPTSSVDSSMSKSKASEELSPEELSPMESIGSASSTGADFGAGLGFEAPEPDAPEEFSVRLSPSSLSSHPSETSRVRVGTFLFPPMSSSMNLSLISPSTGPFPMPVPFDGRLCIKSVDSSGSFSGSGTRLSKSSPELLAMISSSTFGEKGEPMDWSSCVSPSKLYPLLRLWTISAWLILCWSMLLKSIEGIIALES